GAPGRSHGDASGDHAAAGAAPPRSAPRAGHIVRRRRAGGGGRRRDGVTSPERQRRGSPARWRSRLGLRRVLNRRQPMPIFQSDTVTIDRDTDGSYVLKIDVPSKSVNLLTRGVLADLDSALDFLLAEQRVPVVVIRSGKKSGFLAGADIAEF